MTVTGEPGGDGDIAGTLKWLAAGDIADYWGAGNFVALAFEPGDEGATVSVGLDPSQGSGLVPLDEDLNGVFKVTDPAAQVFVVETVKDGETLRQEFSLSDLVLEAEPTPEPPELVATPSTLDLAVGDTGDVVLSLSDGSPLDFPQIAWNTMPDTSVASVTGGDPATGTVTFTAAGAGTTTAVLSYPNGPDTRSTAIIEIGVSAPTPTGFTVSPNPLTVAVGESVTLHGFVDGVEIDAGDLAFDGDFDIADETIADHGSLDDPTIVRGKTAGATSVTVTYLEYPAVTVPVTVTTPTVTVDPSGR